MNLDAGSASSYPFLIACVLTFSPYPLSALLPLEGKGDNAFTLEAFTPRKRRRSWIDLG